MIKIKELEDIVGTLPDIDDILGIMSDDDIDNLELYCQGLYNLISKNDQ